MRAEFFLLLIGIAWGLKLNSGSLITLPNDGYLFTCSPASINCYISIANLPSGLFLQGNRLMAV